MTSIIRPFLNPSIDFAFMCVHEQMMCARVYMTGKLSLFGTFLKLISSLFEAAAAFVVCARCAGNLFAAFFNTNFESKKKL